MSLSAGNGILFRRGHVFRGARNSEIVHRYDVGLLMLVNYRQMDSNEEAFQEHDTRPHLILPQVTRKQRRHGSWFTSATRHADMCFS